MRGPMAESGRAKGTLGLGIFTLRRREIRGWGMSGINQETSRPGSTLLQSG